MARDTRAQCAFAVHTAVLFVICVVAGTVHATQAGLGDGGGFPYDDLRAPAADADTAVDVEWDSNPSLVETIDDGPASESVPPEAPPTVGAALVDAGARVSGTVHGALSQAPDAPATQPRTQPAIRDTPSPASRDAGSGRSAPARVAAAQAVPGSLKFAPRTGAPCVGADGGGASAADCFKAGSTKADNLVAVWNRGRHKELSEYVEAERLLRLAIKLCRPAAASDAVGTGDDLEFVYDGTAAQSYLMLGQMLLSSPEQRTDEAQQLLLTSVLLTTPPEFDMFTVTRDKLKSAPNRAPPLPGPPLATTDVCWLTEHYCLRRCWRNIGSGPVHSCQAVLPTAQVP